MVWFSFLDSINKMGYIPLSRCCVLNKHNLPVMSFLWSQYTYKHKAIFHGCSPH